MSSTYAAVWIDQQEAHVFCVDPSSFSASTVEAADPELEASVRNHADDVPRFFSDVLRALGSAGEILVVGPSSAKMSFVDFLHEQAPAVVVAGMETVDDPTAQQLAGYVRQYFAKVGGELSPLRR